MRPQLGEEQGLQCLSTMPYIPKHLGLPRTLMCQIITPTKALSVRALIDPGSQISAIHKKTGEKRAVKVIKKKELSLKDLELLKREIDVLKVC